jgi:6-phosphogluconolactonase
MQTQRGVRFPFVLTVALAVFAAFESQADKWRTYVGTYTGPKSKGIYLYEFDDETGSLKSVGLAATTEQPSFLAVHPSGQYLYSGNETSSGPGKTGIIASFAIDAKTGMLKELNTQPWREVGPCHVSVDSAGDHVFGANYGTGVIASYRVKPDGSLSTAVSEIQHTGSSVDKGRQQGPHAHCITPSPNNKYVLVADLGLDKILIYKLEEQTGKLTPNTPAFVATPPGGGPRHLAFHPNHRALFANNEMTSSLTVYSYDDIAGAAKIGQTISTLPPDFSGENSTSEVAAHPSGKFVYVANRGHNSIAVFAYDERTMKLKLVENQPTRGKIPRGFVLDPSGKFLIAGNQESQNISVFKIDEKTGKLTPVGEPVEAPTPVSFVFAKMP